MPVVLEQQHGTGLRIGLVNNMPDSALARTERQFIDILDAATVGMPVSLRFYSLPGVPRGETGQTHLAEHGYRPVSELPASDLDALIVTGTEPKSPDLRDEPFWPALSGLFDWIERDGPSTLFSCLAAHAAVLHYDGIERQRLARKRFGLFRHDVVRTHRLVDTLPEQVEVAHSRWNEIPKDALLSHDYQILTQSSDAGVDLFVKTSRNLMVFFQGHPEYDPATLFREYRRDVQRYLTGERETYPDLPENYFAPGECELLDRFCARALDNRSKTRGQDFPLAKRAVAANDQISPMAGVLRAWLANSETVAERSPRFAGMHR